jgi:hypothetical protein
MFLSGAVQDFIPIQPWQHIPLELVHGPTFFGLVKWERFHGVVVVVEFSKYQFAVAGDERAGSVTTVLGVGRFAGANLTQQLFHQHRRLFADGSPGFGIRSAGGVAYGIDIGEAVVLKCKFIYINPAQRIVGHCQRAVFYKIRCTLWRCDVNHLVTFGYLPHHICSLVHIKYRLFSVSFYFHQIMQEVCLDTVPSDDFVEGVRVFFYTKNDTAARVKMHLYVAQHTMLAPVVRSEVHDFLWRTTTLDGRPNPWAWAAECRLGRGSRAMELYEALCPARHNDRIEVRKCEPYSYCQFISGPDHAAFGEAHHPFMTGSGGWSYFAATQYMLGVRPDFDRLVIDPCIPAAWSGFALRRRWRGAEYDITVENPAGVEKGVAALYLNGARVEAVPQLPAGSRAAVRAVMGRKGDGQ